MHEKQIYTNLPYAGLPSEENIEAKLHLRTDSVHSLFPINILVCSTEKER